jgi:hypothetical protein
MKKKLLMLFIIIGLICLLWYIADNYFLSYDYDFNIDEIYKNELGKVDDDTDLSSVEETSQITDDPNEDTDDNEDFKGSSPGNDTSKTIPVTPQEHEQLIVDKYTAKFYALRNVALSNINSLISQALNEYNNTSDNKKSSEKVSLGYKYLRLGRSLEKEIDAKFNSILNDMRSELKKYNLPTSSVNEAQKTYDVEKSERRSYLIDKAFSAN